MLMGSQQWLTCRREELIEVCSVRDVMELQNPFPML